MRWLDRTRSHTTILVAVMINGRTGSAVSPEARLQGGVVIVHWGSGTSEDGLLVLQLLHVDWRDGDVANRVEHWVAGVLTGKGSDV